MKTKRIFLLGIILGLTLFLASCKKVAGGDYYSNGSCPIQRLTFYSTDNVLCYFGGSGGTVTGHYVQDGNTITINVYGTYVYTFHFDAGGCLTQENYSNCTYCEQ